MLHPRRRRAPSSRWGRKSAPHPDAGHVEVRTLLVLPSLLMKEHRIATQGADALGLGSCGGVGVMWCGSRARGGDEMLKLALDPADEACGCVDLRKAGSFTKCTLTAGPIKHCMDGWSVTTLCSCTTRAPRVYSAWQRVRGAPAAFFSGHSCKQHAAGGAG
jgi:hypothetical protein